MFKAVQKEIINEQNKSAKSSLDFDFEYLEKKLKKNQIDIRSILDQVKKFQVAVPTWGVGTGGTRFARFPGIGEPQNIYDKIEGLLAWLHGSIFSRNRKMPTKLVTKTPQNKINSSTGAPLA